MRGRALDESVLAAARDAFVGRIVQVGSRRGGWVTQLVVVVVVETVVENTFVVRVRVSVNVEYTVTWAGVEVIVLVTVVEGTVVVVGGRVVEKTLVMVVVSVVDGVDVTVNVAVGVDVMTTGGPAMIENVLIHANVKPSMTTIQSPENIWLFVSSFPRTSLRSSALKLANAGEGRTYHVDTMSAPSG